jgi:hypothetical protein
MKIKSIYLIGLDVWFLGSSETPFNVSRVSKETDEALEIAHPTYLQIALGKRAFDANLILVRPDGRLSRSTSIYKNDRCLLPDFWSGKVIGTYLTADTQNSDYFTWRVLVELSRNAIHELLELRDWDRTVQYNVLFDAVFPKCSGERVRVDYPKYRSVLYIEPEERLSSKERHITDVAADILSFLDQKGSAQQPHLLFDILLAPDIGIGIPCRKVAAVRLEPIPELKKTDVVMIPTTVWNIASCLEYILQLEHMAERLRILPFYRSTLTEYVTKLRGTDDILTSYENIFLKDRQEELTVRPHIKQLADEFHQAVSTNYLSLTEGTPFSVHIETELSDSAAGYGYDVLQHIKQAFYHAYRDVQEISDHVIARAGAIADFLRDATIADSTRANLSLQVSVKRLTIVTVAITIIALVIGVFEALPEEVRQCFLKVLPGTP